MMQRNRMIKRNPDGSQYVHNKHTDYPPRIDTLAIAVEALQRIYDATTTRNSTLLIVEDALRRIK